MSGLDSTVPANELDGCLLAGGAKLAVIKSTVADMLSYRERTASLWKGALWLEERSVGRRDGLS